ncbi:hypothetical protein Thiowin_04823 [Thiorhodovibrio winogradskyi]|uniref:PPM-type phosphatase domain-containing protein n=1 Tax=Thiorhodovibrio winogradskyi TaxID=77007 RepID=A0ABZ0SFQ6_9GAMM|nr:PP2C family serine/threonine-protein phosphatase [Thiorhodovibrio winogradskyi]
MTERRAPIKVDSVKVNPVKVDPGRRKRLEVDVERLVKGLFQGERVPLFDRGEIRREEIEAFARGDDVFDACFRFVRAMDDAWQARHPGQSLWVSKAARAGTQATRPAPNESASTEPAPTEPKTMMAEPNPMESVPDSEPQAAPTPPSAPVPGPEPEPPIQPPSQPAARQTPKQPPGQQQPAHATFFLPNAKVGVAYAAAIEGQDIKGEPVEIRDLRLPDELGLTFDAQTSEIRGTPRTAGDHRLAVSWGRVAGTSYSGDCLLIVNPDPKSLWKIIEPPTDALYPKPHTDCQRIESASGVQLIAASRRGRSHEHQGSFRDDDAFIQADIGAGWQVLMVADGAGSAKFSREGSRLACTAMAETLADALAGDQGAQLAGEVAAWSADARTATQSLGTAFHYLFHQAATSAVQAIAHEAERQGARARDYATTLLAAVAKPQDDGLFLTSFWMGDGAIAVYGPTGKLRLMGKPDSGEFAGQTRFLDNAALTDSGFAKRIGIGYFQEIGAVLLMTDGVSDPRFETDNGLEDPTRWDALWRELSPILESEAPERGLLDWLGFFSPGHHDDRSIAILRA